MAEELPGHDQPAEFVATQARNVINPAALGLRQAIPTPERGARRVDGKPMLLLEIDRGRFNASSVDGYLQFGAQDQGAVRVTESSAEASRIKALVQAVDPNSDIPLVCGHALGDDLQLVGLEPGTIPVIGVGKAPPGFIARPARLNRIPGAEVTDGRFATLPVLAEELAATFG